MRNSPQILLERAVEYILSRRESPFNNRRRVLELLDDDDNPRWREIHPGNPDLDVAAIYDRLTMERDMAAAGLGRMPPIRITDRTQFPEIQHMLAPQVRAATDTHLATTIAMLSGVGQADIAAPPTIAQAIANEARPIRLDERPITQDNINALAHRAQRRGVGDEDGAWYPYRPSYGTLDHLRPSEPTSESGVAAQPVVNAPW